MTKLDIETKKYYASHGSDAARTVKGSIYGSPTKERTRNNIYEI